MAQIVLDEVSKIYSDGTEAVSGLNLDIADGEFMVLVGPSGCGKTTALRMVAGLETISKGEVSIGDRIVTESDPPGHDFLANRLPGVDLAERLVALEVLPALGALVLVGGHPLRPHLRASGHPHRPTLALALCECKQRTRPIIPGPSGAPPPRGWPPIALNGDVSAAEQSRGSCRGRGGAGPERPGPQGQEWEG